MRPCPRPHLNELVTAAPGEQPPAAGHLVRQVVHHELGAPLRVDGELEVRPRLRGDLVDQVIEAIMKAAKTGKVGDGKIFITDIERVIRIRTGETDDAAL